MVLVIMPFCVNVHLVKCVGGWTVPPGATWK